MIRIAVLSDSHGLLRRSVVQKLEGCSHILHAGDIVTESTLDELALYGQLFAVRGNCDRWVRGLSGLAGCLRFQIGGVSFLMVHDPYDIPRDLSGVDVVVHGHTHLWREERLDGRLYLNPGSCGRARFGTEVTMAYLHIDDKRNVFVERIELDDIDY